MPSQPLSPAQALWQHYGTTPQTAEAAPVRHNPVQQKELYARLQKLNTAQRPAQPNAVAALVSPSGTNWQAVSQRADETEGLGLSEM